MGTYNYVPNSDYFTLEQIAAGVYAAIIKDGMGAWGNAGIIDLGDETLIFDTFSTPRAAMELRKVAEQLTQRKASYVVNSHWHFDHVLGNQVFNDATIISTTRTRELILSGLDLSDIEKSKSGLKEHIKDLEKQKELQTQPLAIQELVYEIEEKNQFVNALPTVQLTLPTVTFQEMLQIHGSRRSVELISFGGGHTKSDAILYLPQEKIAFMGDLVLVDFHPWMGSGQPQEWPAILEGVKPMEIDTLVPGHGNIGTKKHIDHMIHYLTWIQDTVRTSIERGDSLEQILSIRIPDTFADWRAPHVFEWNLNALYKAMS